jgi:membrane-associated phospholipid phosphatase
MKMVRLRRVCALVLALAGWAVCTPARATEPLPESVRPARRLALPSGFRRSNEADYALTLAGFAGTLTLVLGFQPSGAPRWDRAVLFDEPARDALRAESSARRSAYDLASNVTQYSSVAFVAFDAFGFAWASERSPHVARELFWMDAEAYAVTLLVTNLTKRLAVRRRPYAAPCSNDSSYVGHCGSREENLSFFSGHSAISGTSAGLACAQHQYLRLYGGAGDALACGGALAAMTATGLLRIASDNHWASDVAVGYLVGFASGYGLPLLLHFQHEERPRRSRDPGMQLRILPLGDGSRFSMFAVGVF